MGAPEQRGPAGDRAWQVTANVSNFLRKTSGPARNDRNGMTGYEYDWMQETPLPDCSVGVFCVFFGIVKNQG